MAFETIETSRHQGSPVDLFLFRYGLQPTSYFAYTNALNAITYHDAQYDMDIVYEPVSIMRDNIKSSGTLDQSSMRITAAKDISIGELFRVYPPSNVVGVTIRQGHVGDTEFLVAWAGRVLSYNREGDEAVLTGEPISTSMRRTGLRKHYQFGCPHKLYGAACKAVQASFTLPAVVASVSGLTVTLTPGWTAIAQSRYRQGEFRWVTADDGETQIRQILRVPADNTFALSGSLLRLPVGAAVEVSLGCSHDLPDCALFSNQPNYGGCKWIPVKNPIGFVNGFY